MAEGDGNNALVQVGYRSINYKEVTPDYVFGGVKPSYIEMVVVTTKANAFEKIVNQKDVIEHTEELTLKIPSMQAKLIAVWLLQNIKLYESTFGQIPSIETDPAKKEIIKKVEDLLATL